ncbi:heterokaryon incompatibility protein-domain-containing protein [Rhexocercosporidium sp. MPI-PUGE-AT-0058]|nr:heterokaryon incompatibility protein-domain-containing protein [Rhexocercosporidium sp. MPI-PUGE-AT-0058]
MRLLHSISLEFEECEIKEFEIGQEDNPKYAILSHTWGSPSEEVSFQELPHMRAATQGQKLGFYKIKRCGEVAAAADIDYIWVDTCCIDKTSSAELTQAINSMYFWYQQAEVCYVYLADVSSRELAKSGNHPSFCNSKWFTRGWTLQELIAPKDVYFYSSEWELIGKKDDLLKVLHEVTGIYPGALNGTPMKRFSVAERMSWAAKRETTRSEDMAYCLMGIFDVNMPLLYGERMKKAFIRLQEEIMKSSDDQSIFA